MDYFRFYHSVIDNPKLHRLPADTYRVWTFCLCIASRRLDRGTLPPAEELPFELHMFPNRDDEVTAHLELLVARKLLTRGPDGTLSVTDWGLYQGMETKSTQRVRKHRAKRKGELSGRSDQAQPSPPHHETFQKPFHETSVTRGNVFKERENNLLTEVPSSFHSETQTKPPQSENPPTPLPGEVFLIGTDRPPDDPETVDVGDLAEDLFPASGMAPLARRACREFPPAWVKDALRIASEARATRWKYVEGVLKNFQAQGGPPSARASPGDGLSPTQRRRRAKIQAFEDFYSKAEAGG